MLMCTSPQSAGASHSTRELASKKSTGRTFPGENAEVMNVVDECISGMQLMSASFAKVLSPLDGKSVLCQTVLDLVAL